SCLFYLSLCNTCASMICFTILCVFFFSSRRRHTRFSRDWSSDVCSSDLGMIEEASEEAIRAHFDVNALGAVWVCQAVVPHLRRQGAGRILNVTSMGSGGGFAWVGFYGAGKAALDSITEALAMEVEPFGIKVTNLQLGGY